MSKENNYSLLHRQMETNKKKKKEVIILKEVKAGPSKQVAGTSKKETVKKKKEEHEENPNIPDKSYGDYFCRMCDSHMNSDDMWTAHITGKKHIKNIKKGDTETKYEDLDVESIATLEFKDVREPVVGLSFIHELRRPEPGIPAMYNCFLCPASIASPPLVREHVFTLKHRLNYIKEASDADYELLTATNLKKNSLEPLVVEAAGKLEEEKGRGTIQVRQEKPKIEIPFVNKRKYDDLDDMYHRPPKAKPNNEINIWKNVDVPKSKMDFEDNRRMYDKNRNLLSDGDYSADYKLQRASRRSPSPDYRRSSEYRRSTEVRRSPDYRRSSEYRRSPEVRRSPEYRRPSEYHRSPSSSPETKYRKYGISSRYEFDDHGRSEVTKFREVHEYSHNSTTSVSTSDVDRRPYDVPLPQEASSSKSNNLSTASLSSLYDDFLAITNRPSEIFLKVVLMKLERMDSPNVEEFTLLSKIIGRAQALMCTRLPPDVQNMIIKGFDDQMSARNPASSAPAYTPAAVPAPEMRGVNMLPHQANMLPVRDAQPHPSNMLPVRDAQPHPSTMLPVRDAQPHPSPYQSGGSNIFPPPQNLPQMNPSASGPQSHQPFNNFAPPSFNNAFSPAGPANFRKF